MKISIGFEYETQHISFVEFNKNIIYNSEEFKKFELSKSSEKIIEVYPDSFTFVLNNKFNTQKRVPFLKKYTGIEFEYIKITTNNPDKYIYILQKDVQKIFTNAEFISTYPKLMNVEKTKILNHMIHYCKKGIIDFLSECNEIFLEKYELRNDMIFQKDNESKFPYDYLIFNEKKNIGLLMRNNPEKILTDFPFMIQCTIGCHIEDVSYIIHYLTNVFSDDDNDKYHKILYSVQQNVDQLFYEGEWKMKNEKQLKNIFFLFFYTAMTIDDRRNKRSLFIIRHAVTNIIKKDLCREDIIQIQLVFELDETLSPYSEYLYEIIEAKNKSETDKIQGLLYSGTFPYENNQILIEFRGFQNILKKQCSKKQNLYLKDIIDCKPL